MDEIFVSDGAKSDVGNILDLFDKDNTVLVPDPVYPVYVDTTSWPPEGGLRHATAENGFPADAGRFGRRRYHLYLLPQ